MDKIFGDTSLADFENARLMQILETANTEQINVLGSKLREKGLRLLRDLTSIVLQMQPYRREMQKLFTLAAAYSGESQLAFRRYVDLLENNCTQQQLQAAEMDQTTFYQMAQAEIERVENSPEYLVAKSRLSELYLSYEEVLLALNTIVIPDEIAADYEP